MNQLSHQHQWPHACSPGGGLVTARTAGRARTTAELSVDQAAPNPSRARAPTTAATGPAAANATGPNANAATAWKALTRPSTPGGSCCCSAAAANVLPRADPAPATRTPASPGPATVAADRAAVSRALALTRSSRGASSVVSPLRAGVKTASPVPPGHCEQDEHPQRRPPGEHCRGQRGLGGAARGVRPQHDRPPADPVGEHPAAQHEEHLRHDPRRQDDPEVARRAAGIENGEGDGERGHGGAQERGGVPGEEPDEVLTGRARLSYRRAAEIFTEVTRPFDPAGRGWTLSQLRP